MATGQSNGQDSSQTCRSSQDFDKSRGCDKIQSRDKSQSREKRRSRDNMQSRSRSHSSRGKRRSQGPEQDQVVGRRRNQDPLKGLVRIILHFCLFFWLQLLVSIFWTSSNSSGDSCNSSGDSSNSSGDSCNNSSADSSSISCDNNCNELLPSKSSDMEVRTVIEMLYGPRIRTVYKMQ
jgi:hypothetical protein